MPGNDDPSSDFVTLLKDFMTDFRNVGVESFLAVAEGAVYFGGERLLERTVSGYVAVLERQRAHSTRQGE